MTGKDHFIDDSNEYKFRSFELNFYGKKSLTSVAGFLFIFFLSGQRWRQRGVNLTVSVQQIAVIQLTNVREYLL